MAVDDSVSREEYYVEMEWVEDQHYQISNIKFQISNFKNLLGMWLSHHWSSTLCNNVFITYGYNNIQCCSHESHYIYIDSSRT
jgi:hypothetical protein